MRSDLSPDLFFQRMKKKPALQAIIDNLEQYTEQDLSNIQGQPLWIREALVRLKRRNGTKLLTPLEMADLMTNQPEAKPSTFPLYEWIASSDWIGHRTKTSSYMIEVVEGDPLLILSNQEILHGFSLVTIDVDSYNKIINKGKAHGVTTMEKYKELYRSVINLRYR